MTAQAPAWYLRRDTAAMPGDSPAYGEIEAPKWFGPYAERAGPAAWEQVQHWCRRTFPGCHLLRTPVQTALALAEHTLPWARGSAPYAYLVLSPDTQTLIARHCTHGQHRYEDCGPGGATITAVVLYDARVSHAAHLRHLPVVLRPDDLLHDERSEYIPFRRGFYRVDVTVPRGWKHVGLVPASGPGYPHRPGFSFESWLSWQEVRLLAEQRWPFAIRERLLFAPPETPGADPLRAFHERLTTSLERLEALPRSDLKEALRAALRALALHLIGNLARGASENPQGYATLEELPDDLSPSATVSHEAPGYIVREQRPLDLYHARWYRPEWAADIWANTRVAVTRHALRVPRADLLAIDGDGLYLRADPGWPDSGKVGCYRRQATWRGALTVPRPSSSGYPQRDALRRVKAGKEPAMEEQ
jgi:hypothetical protein